LLGVRFFLRQVDVRLDVDGKRTEFFVGGDLLFGALAVAQHGLRFVLIAPKIGIGSAPFETL
jgi:hypothetical protein